MNWSMYTADRTTHLKIVVVGLAAALLIAVIGISARELNLGVDIMTAQGTRRVCGVFFIWRDLLRQQADGDCGGG